MNLNIRQSDCKFYVNKEARKVVCVYDNVEKLFINYIEDTPIFLWSSYKDYEKFRMPSSFRGIATCAPGDEFDEEYGRLLAFNKMKEKLNTSFFKRADTFIDGAYRVVSETLEDFNKLVDSLVEGSNRREAKLREKYPDKEENN